MGGMMHPSDSEVKGSLPNPNRRFKKSFILMAAIPSKTVIAGPDGQAGMSASVKPFPIETIQDLVHFFGKLQSQQALPFPDPMLQMFVVLSEACGLLEEETGMIVGEE